MKKYLFLVVISFSHVLIAQSLDEKFKLVYASNSQTFFSSMMLTDTNATLATLSQNDVTENTYINSYIKILEDGSQIHVAPALSGIGITDCLPSETYNGCREIITNLKTSGNGVYTYYLYNKIYSWGSTFDTGSLVIHNINSGPLKSDTLINLKNLGFNMPHASSIYSYFDVNNNGDAVAVLYRDLPNGETERGVFSISRTGVVLRVTTPGEIANEMSVKINDQGVIFYGYSSGVNVSPTVWKMDAFFSNGTRKNIFTHTSPETPIVDYRNFFVVNQTTEDHPEGLVYSINMRNEIQIVSTDGKTIFDLNQFNLKSTELQIATFSILKINKTGDFLWVGHVLGDASNGFKSFVFFKDQTQPLIKTGDLLYGKAVGSNINNIQLNETGSYTFTDADSSNSLTRTFLGKIRKSCSVSDKTMKVVDFFPQSGNSWGGNLYAWHKTAAEDYGTITKGGCVMTSAAMILNYHGLNKLPLNSSGARPEFNPGSVNEIFRGFTDLNNVEVKVYNESSNVVYSRAAHVGRAIYQKNCFEDAKGEPNFIANQQNYKRACIDQSKVKMSYREPVRWDRTDTIQKEKSFSYIEKEICNGKPVLLRVEKEIPVKNKRGEIVANRYSGHTVVAIASEYTPEGKLTFKVHDPSRRELTENITLEELATRSIARVGQKYKYVVGYDLLKPELDPSMITISASDEVEFVLTDNFGRRAGFDPINNISYNEIPGAVYSYEGLDSNVASDEELPERYHIGTTQLFLGTGVESGNYQIKLFGVDDGVAKVSITKTDIDGFITDTEEHEIMSTIGSQQIINFKHSIASIPVSNTELKVNYAKYNDNSIKIHGEIINSDAFTISCGSILKLNIGSINDYGSIFNLHDFKIRKIQNETFYELDNANIKIIISERGWYWIELKNIDLQSINKLNWGEITLGIDEQIGRINLNLKCENGVCYEE